MKTAVSGLQAVMLALVITLVICLSVGMQPINAQQFTFYLCFATTSVYEQNYVYFHNTQRSLPPFPVCGYTTAQMAALNAQLRAKYGY